MILEYLANEPITLAEVKSHCRADGGDDALLEDVIIPSARALAETRSGCAIRLARYQAYYDDMSLVTLPVSGVTEIESVKVDDAKVEYKATTSRRLTVVSTQTSMSGCITFKAGIDISKHPDVKAWMLLACGWLYSQRELLLTGVQPAMPNIAESLLCSISVPSGF